MRRSDLVLMGRASGAFGLKGEIRIYLFSHDPVIFSRAQKFYAGSNPEEAKPYTFISLRTQGKRLILRTREIKNREEADTLKGAWVYLERVALPEPEEDEYYWFQVVGTEVFLPDGSQLGRVAQVMEAGAHDLWLVKDDQGREAILPVTEEVVLSMDLAGGRIEVDPPEGLLEAQGFAEK